MKPICVLWDASPLWCLLIWHALRELTLPFQLVKGQSIAREGLPDKASVCIVPGGFARTKAQTLQTAGLRAIQHFVKSGGNYLGICGGAGLGLSTQSDESLGLCPWHRDTITERLQHFINGHMHASLIPHDLIPHDLIPKTLGSTHNDILLPVWWPGRFAVPNHTTNVDILATYKNPSHDMAIADMLLTSIPKDIQQEWKDVYGVTLGSTILQNQPCIIHGKYGTGKYVLSYSHLETPDSPQANTFLYHLMERFTGLTPAHIKNNTLIPPWTPYNSTPNGHEELINAFNDMKDVLSLGHAHGLLFSRTPWLHGWRAGVPGHGLNTLALTLAVLAKEPLEPEAARLWQNTLPLFINIFPRFTQGTASCLLAQRLAASAPDMVPMPQLQERRMALFGSAMHADGIYQELMNLIEPILFAQCNALAIKESV